MAGGSFCNSNASCRARAKSRLGSTQNWTCVLPGKDKGNGDYENAHQPASGDPKRNPAFYTWNRVYIRYCSGDLYLGRRKASSNHFGVNTLGYNIMTATFEDLLMYHGLANATTVLIGGSSAGGIGAFTLLDLLNNMINMRSGNKTSVYGFNDGGWFRAFRPYNEYISNGLSQVTNLHASQWSLGLGRLFGAVFNMYAHPGCFLPRQSNPLFGQDCVLTELTAPYVKTPYFVLTARWDTFDLHLKLALLYGCSATLGSLPPDAQKYVSYYGNYTENTLQTFMSDKNGLFLPNCYKHTSFGFDVRNNQGPPCGAINGLTGYQAMVNWLNALESGQPNAGTASSVIDPTPDDALMLSCNSQCGASQCSWATNLDGNNGTSSCASVPIAYQASYGRYQEGTLCPAIFATPTQAAATTVSGTASLKSIKLSWLFTMVIALLVF